MAASAFLGEFYACRQLAVIIKSTLSLLTVDGDLVGGNNALTKSGSGSLLVLERSTAQPALLRSRLSQLSATG